MPTQVTRWLASDGTMFTTEAEAIAYETTTLPKTILAEFLTNTGLVGPQYARPLAEKLWAEYTLTPVPQTEGPGSSVTEQTKPVKELG